MKNKKLFIMGMFLLCTILFTGCFNTDFTQKYGTNITEYNIELELKANNTINGKQIVNYKNTSSAILSEIYFHLYANSFSETAVNKPVSTLYESTAYPNGKSYGKIEISDVNCKDDDCSFALEGTDKDLLKVTLTTPLYPNDFIKIDMDYTITIPNVLHRFGYNENTINLGNFYPVASVFDGENWDKHSYHYNGDPFYSTLANYSVKITYPSKLTLAHTGTETDCQKLEATTTSTLSAKAVRDFAMVLSDKFEMISTTVNSTQIKYYFYDDEQSQKSLETAKQALQTFNEVFGKYPYSTLSVVETGFLHGGMEFPNLVMISDSLKTYDDYTNTIVHEIAHQWWYGVVGNDQYNNAWLDESLAEYSVVIFYENNPQYEIKRETCISNAITSYTLFVDVYKNVFKEVDTSMNRSLDQYDTEPEYVYAIYVRGMIMFDDIRNFVGDRQFFKALKSYYKQYGGKIATPENLIGVFEDVSGKRIKNLFNSYLDGIAIIANTNVKSESANS